jgi:hypothetical protein
MCTEAVSSSSQGVNVGSAVPVEGYTQSCWHRSHLHPYNLDNAEGKVVSQWILRIISSLIYHSAYEVQNLGQHIFFQYPSIMIRRPMSCMSSVVLDLSLAFF